MNSDNIEQQRSLRAEVERSEREMQSLEQDLAAVDAELGALAARRHQYEVLSQACRSLEELDELGAMHLFWDPQGNLGGPDAHLRNARQSMESFNAEVAAVEERRRSIVEQIGDKNGLLEGLHYDLYDAIEEEESRQNEWLIEREENELPDRVQVMPWARGCEEDRRFNRSLAASVFVCIAVGWIVSIVDLPIFERDTVIELPERVARLVRKERTPPPPAAVEDPVLPAEEPPEPEPKLVEEPPPETAEKPVVAAVEQPTIREQVKSKGILAFRDSFANRSGLKPSARLGSQARVSNAGAAAAGRPQRSMVTTSAPGSSGGINLADISRDVGGGGQGLAGVQVTRAASSIGGAEGPDRPLSAGVMAGRTDEEIQIVFDRYKAALYRLYNRELRKDPTLRGQIVLRLTIEPDGSVSLCALQSSDMGAPVLASQVVTRVSNFDFGAKDGIGAMTIIYPIDFLPAA